jgi:sugar transferase (PEP-CTERM/EpsH1 system associated)
MARAIRVLHVVDSLGRGGLENGLVNLVRYSDRDRFEHTVCAIRRLGPNAEHLEAAGARIVCLNEEGKARFQFWKLAQIIRDVSPDLVHSRNWAAIEAVAAGRWVHAPALVHSEHGLEAETSITEPRRRSWFRRLAFELADRVLSVSCQLRDLHAKRTGFPAERITVIHNGVDSRRFQPNAAVRARIREELGLSPGEFCIGCVANLSPAKDYPTALRGVEVFNRLCDRWRFLAVGEGPERSSLEELVRATPGLRGRVTFLGTSHRVPELLAAMDVYLLSSVIEGMSNSLLEAMASGLPAIATSVGGNPEVVVDGESGLLFPAGDFQRLAEQLLLLYEQVNVRMRMSQRARVRIQEVFSIDSMVRNYEEVYESLTAAVPQRAAVAV